MSKSLDRTITHYGSPFLQSKTDDLFHFTIPPDERYKEARLDILDGRYNAGADIVSQPTPGETGAGKTIQVQWWFDGDPEPPTPPFIRYRIRAFTVPVTSRAILVAIENTGQLPFPIDLSAALRKVIERFVDTVAEAIAEQTARVLFREYYEEVEILVDTNCTKENIRDKIAELGKDYTLDLAILGHGGVYPPESDQGILILHNGMDNWWDNPNNLTKSDVRAWKDRPEFQGLKLGLVYMMNCYGSKFNDAWCDLGFKTSIGTYERNWMPEPMFTFFWTRFRNGETAQDAARKAWETSRGMWQIIHRPKCKLVRIPRPPFINSDIEDNGKITESHFVVSGEPNLVIKDNACNCSPWAPDQTGLTR
jgi:hypothetical protein